MKHFVKDLLFGLAMLAALPFSAYEIRKDIHYYDPDFPRTGDSAYLDERCTLDLYYPTHRKDLVVFHGSGLIRGSKTFYPALEEQDIAAAAVNYRLSPQAKMPGLYL